MHILLNTRMHLLQNFALLNINALDTGKNRGALPATQRRKTQREERDEALSRCHGDGVRRD
jgi:hypothetical protein